MTPDRMLRLIDEGLDYLVGQGGPQPSDAARRIMLAIALQESGPMLDARYQNSPSNTPGPARGFWQFEQGGGVAGVLAHPASGAIVNRCCVDHAIVPQAAAVWRALEGHDKIAVVFARMLLFTDPRALATTQQEAWDYYVRNWRPGKPHPENWPNNWRIASDTVGS